MDYQPELKQKQNENEIKDKLEQIQYELREREQKSSCLFGKLEDYLDQQLNQRNKVESIQETATIPQGGDTFSKEGFPFVALFVDQSDAGKTLVIELMGHKSSVTLDSGLNQLDFVDGSRLSIPSGNITAVLIRSNYQYKEAKESTVMSIVESVEGSGNASVNFKQIIKGITFSNDSAGNATLKIKDVTITVKANEVFTGEFTPFNSMTITSSGSYRLTGKA